MKILKVIKVNPNRKWVGFGHDFFPTRFFGQKFRATGNVDLEKQAKFWSNLKMAQKTRQAQP